MINQKYLNALSCIGNKELIAAALLNKEQFTKFIISLSKDELNIFRMKFDTAPLRELTGIFGEELALEMDKNYGENRMILHKLDSIHYGYKEIYLIEQQPTGE
jgi:hypothetical protein